MMSDLKRYILASGLALCGLVWAAAQQPRSEFLLEKNWKFVCGDEAGAMNVAYDDSKWQTVSVPHDWAIYGPFGGGYDVQNVAIEQDGQTEASEMTGRTGGLPFVVTGWYRNSFSVPAGKTATLVFDGAMSEARVYVNGHEATF